jgi:uncharacterized protein YukE
VVSDLERIAELMRGIATMMRSTSGDLMQQVSQMERQLAQVEQIMRGSRDRHRIVSFYVEAIQKTKGAVAALRHAAKLSEE